MIFSLALMTGLTAMELPEIKRRQWFLREAAYAIVPHDVWKKHVAGELVKMRLAGEFDREPDGYVQALESWLTGEYYLARVPQLLLWQLSELDTDELAHIESHGQFGVRPRPKKLAYLANVVLGIYSDGLWRARDAYDHRPHTLD